MENTIKNKVNIMLYKALLTKDTSIIPNRELLENMGYRFVKGYSKQNYWGILPGEGTSAKGYVSPLVISKNGIGETTIYWDKSCRVLKKGENVRSVAKKMDLCGVLFGYRKTRVRRRYGSICLRIEQYKCSKADIEWATSSIKRLDESIKETESKLARYEASKELQTKKLQDAQVIINKIMKEVRK